MNTNRPLALVSGASSGIGAELSIQLASRGYDLLLTGRNQSRLDTVAEKARAKGSTVEMIVLDLSHPADGVSSLLKAVGSRELRVLVNNAGFGLSGPMAEADPAELASMVQLNITSLTLVTRAFVPAMKARGEGRILNVASTASFQPIPGMAVYGASKAYVLSFSEALAEELSGTGVTVTALCPGPTATGFADRAALGSASVFRNAMTAEAVAEIGVRALFKGKRVQIAGALNTAMAFGGSVLSSIVDS